MCGETDDEQIVSEVPPDRQPEVSPTSVWLFLIASLSEEGGAWERPELSGAESGAHRTKSEGGGSDDDDDGDDDDDDDDELSVTRLKREQPVN